MPFIPHTDQDLTAMLDALGLASVDDLFVEIPAELRCHNLQLPEGLNEMQVGRAAEYAASQDAYHLSFMGAGAYEHHIPAAVWDIASRGEYMTAYTPYQAEASQGSLQLIYEYQTMIARLTGMEAANASMYDGASSLAEAILMARRIKRGAKSKVLLPAAVHPAYRHTLKTFLTNQGVELVAVPYCKQQGVTLLDGLDAHVADSFALVIPQPNFFGCLEQVDEMTDWAHQHDLLSIAVVNPTALALLKPPGEWGESGADIVCGEGQPLGVPLSSGGPYFGFFACKKAYVRQMPGRLVGRTTDEQGREGFTLTLQAREQHIRRAKATSNICTNQGLLVTAATVYMSLLGPEGLYNVAAQSHANTELLKQQLAELPGVAVQFNTPCFHETVIQLPLPAAEVIAVLAQHGIEAGYDLSAEYPELGNALLVCATETKTAEDIAVLVSALAEVIAVHSSSSSRADCSAHAEEVSHADI